MPLEVVIFFGKLVIFFLIEHFSLTTSAVPERHLALGLQATQLIENLRAHGSHAGTTADKDYLRVSILGKELTKRTIDRYFVAGLKREHPGRHLARWQIGFRRRSGDPDIELQNTQLFRIVGHGISADRRLIDL